jgi:glycosyltransferase involved in cell wall biosynthesis
MQILFITNSLPYPPDTGSRTRTWQLLQYLYQKDHQVILTSFVSPEEEGYVQFLWQVCSGVYPVPVVPSFLNQSNAFLRSILTGRPFLVERDAHQEMRSTVRSILDSGQIDLIQVQNLSMAQYAFLPYDDSMGRARGINRDRRHMTPAGNQPTLLLDVNQAEWTLAERMHQSAPGIFRFLFALEAKRIKQVEGVLVGNFDHVISSTDKTVEKLLEAKAFALDQSEKDGKKALAKKNDSFTTIHNGLEISDFPLMARLPGSKTIFSMGSFNNPAFTDGIDWFLQEALPQILQQVPEARLVVMAMNPPVELQKLAEQTSGAVTFVRDLSALPEYLKASALAVVPVRSGRGFRQRTLELLAYGMPVVSTGVGLEGLAARPGEDLLLADTPSKFIGEVIRLLFDQALQSRLSTAARELVESRYTWQAALADLDKIYGRQEQGLNV